MNGLVEWLHARLDAEEQRAGEAGGVAWHALGPCVYDGDPGVTGHRNWVAEAETEAQAAYIAEYDPARALRQVEAGRRILARHRVDESDHAWRYSAPRYCVGCGYQGDCDDPVTEDIDRCPELLDLAYGLGIEA